MATYEKVSNSLLVSQQHQLITAVAAGDQIDVVDVLGRPARGIQMYTSSVTDVVDYKLNNLVRIPQFNETSADTEVLVWSGASHHPTYQSTGAVISTIDGLVISSIEITALALGIGTTIEIVVW